MLQVDVSQFWFKNEILKSVFPVNQVSGKTILLYVCGLIGEHL
jgi:hypothetical protein